MSLPKALYHGSADLRTTLKPVSENENTPAILYAVEDKNHAIEMAFSAVLSSRFPLDRFTMKDDEVIIDLNVLAHPLTKAMLNKMVLYIYLINPKHSDGWVPVKSRYCTSVSEWQTQKLVLPSRCETLKVFDWLRNRKITINHPRFK